VILSKFWSGYDFQKFRNRKVLDDDQELLSKGTLQLGYYRTWLRTIYSIYNMWARSFFPRADCNFLAPLKEYYRHCGTPLWFPFRQVGCF
jgi:hypothetical protein